MAVLGADRPISPIFAALRVQGPFFTVVRSGRAIRQLINDPTLTRIFCSSQYKKIRKFTEIAHLIIQGKNPVEFNHLLNSHLMKKDLNDHFRPLQLEANCLESSTIFSLMTPCPLLRSPERESTIDLRDNSPQIENIRDRSPSEVWHDYVSDWEQS